MTASCECKHLSITLGFFSGSCLALRILIFLFFLFTDTKELSCLETCIFLPVLKAGKVNYSNKGVVTRECMGSTLIFNQFENGKVSHNSFFSNDLKLQNVQSCHFKKYGKTPEICCGRNSFLLCILLYSTSANHIIVLDARVFHL